jgi:RNA polymerase sigma-70 factor (ECF subfamily)
MAGPNVEASVDQRGLVERARQGDHDAFAELARATVVRLDQAARLILRDPELARDAVQEGLIRAWRDLPKLRDPDRFDAWLYRLTVNSCIDQTRRRRRRPIEVELTVLHAPAITDISAALADRDQVDGVLRHLDERGRAIVVLHYVLGLPLTEVAGTLGIPVGTVKSRLNRALVQMRVAMAAEPKLSPTSIAGGQLA